MKMYLTLWFCLSKCSLFGLCYRPRESLEDKCYSSWLWDSPSRNTLFFLGRVLPNGHKLMKGRLSTFVSHLSHVDGRHASHIISQWINRQISFLYLFPNCAMKMSWLLYSWPMNRPSNYITWRSTLYCIYISFPVGKKFQISWLIE